MPRLKPIAEMAVILAAALLLAFAVQAVAMKPYRIPSGSMEPTLDVGQRVLVNRLSTRLGSHPKVGDIIVFHPPAGAETETCGVGGQGPGTSTACTHATSKHSGETFIKRVVAVAGDHISIRNGHVVRDGVLQREPFARSCGGGTECELPHTFTVPAGTVFLMGDNRGDSSDSRFWGPVPLKWVVGKAVATYWPPGRLGTL